MDLSKMTGTQLLRAAGYGHRPHAMTGSTGTHDILRHDGTVMCQMDAHEASAFALAKLDGVLFTFDGWEVPKGLPRADEPQATAALRLLVAALQCADDRGYFTPHPDDSEMEADEKNDTTAALDNARQVLEKLDAAPGAFPPLGKPPETDGDFAAFCDDVFGLVASAFSEIGLDLTEESRTTIVAATGQILRTLAPDRLRVIGVERAEERADLVSEALRCAVAVFESVKVHLEQSSVDAITAALEDALDEAHPVDRATRLGVDPGLIDGGR